MSCVITPTSAKHTCKTSRALDREYNDIDIVIKLWLEYCFNLKYIEIISAL